jgi:hypothetical protein
MSNQIHIEPAGSGKFSADVAGVSTNRIGDQIIVDTPQGRISFNPDTLRTNSDANVTSDYKGGFFIAFPATGSSAAGAALGSAASGLATGAAAAGTIMGVPALIAFIVIGIVLGQFVVGVAILSIYVAGYIFMTVNFIVWFVALALSIASIYDKI